MGLNGSHDNAPVALSAEGDHRVDLYTSDTILRRS